MLLLGALFALFIVGFWCYCLIDVALTPRSECRGLPKAAWLVIVAATFAVGGVVWLASRRPARIAPNPPAGTDGPVPPSPPEGRDRPLPRKGRPAPRDWDGQGNTGWDAPGMPASLEAEAALLRHPAGRSRRRGASSRPRPKGPDDDPEFLQSLDKAIRGLEAGDDPAE
jgi:hypothetical protein